MEGLSDVQRVRVGTILREWVREGMVSGSLVEIQTPLLLGLLDDGLDLVLEGVLGLQRVGVHESTGMEIYRLVPENVPEALRTASMDEVIAHIDRLCLPRSFVGSDTSMTSLKQSLTSADECINALKQSMESLNSA